MIRTASYQTVDSWPSAFGEVKWLRPHLLGGDSLFVDGMQEPMKIGLHEVRFIGMWQAQRYDVFVFKGMMASQPVHRVFCLSQKRVTGDTVPIANLRLIPYKDGKRFFAVEDGSPRPNTAVYPVSIKGVDNLRQLSQLRRGDANLVADALDVRPTQPTTLPSSKTSATLKPFTEANSVATPSSALKPVTVTPVPTTKATEAQPVTGEPITIDLRD